MKTSGERIIRSEQLCSRNGKQWTGYEYVPCRCKKYDGPIPVEQYLGQRLTLPQVDQ